MRVLLKRVHLTNEGVTMYKEIGCDEIIGSQEREEEWLDERPDI